MDKIDNLSCWFNLVQPSIDDYLEELKALVEKDLPAPKKGVLYAIGEIHLSGVYRIAHQAIMLTAMDESAEEKKIQLLNRAHQFLDVFTKANFLKIELIGKLSPDRLYSEGTRNSSDLENKVDWTKPIYLDEGNPHYAELVKIHNADQIGSKKWNDLHKKRESLWVKIINDTFVYSQYPLLVAGRDHVGNFYGLKEKLARKHITLEPLTIKELEQLL